MEWASPLRRGQRRRRRDQIALLAHADLRLGIGRVDAGGNAARFRVYWAELAADHPRVERDRLDGGRRPLHDLFASMREERKDQTTCVIVASGSRRS